MRETTSGHPTWRRLVDYHDGVLSGTWLERTQAHLESDCERCDGALEEVALLQTAIAVGPLAAPPRAAVNRVRRLFVARRLAGAVERVRTLVARLVFDQRTEPVPALRSASGSERRLLWNLGDHELFVTATRQGASWELQGQFLPASGDPGATPSGWVCVRPGTGPERLTELDGDGVFVVSGLRPGGYALDADLDGIRGLVPAFTLD